MLIVAVAAAVAVISYLKGKLTFPLLFSQKLDGVALEKLPGTVSDRVYVNLLTRICTKNPRLSKLALPFCDLDFTQEPRCQQVLDVLHTCPSLSRLDLSGAILTDRLGQVLDCLRHPLEFLNLSYCSLSLEDLDSLFESKHRISLRDLNLSYIYSPHCEECKRSRPNPQTKGQNEDPFSFPLPDLDSFGDAASFEVEDYSGWMSPVGGGDSWKFWSSQRSISSPTPGNCFLEHAEDRSLARHAFGHLDRFPNLVILDMNCDHFGRFRVDGETLELIESCIHKLKFLKYLTVEDLPLWDEDIFSLVGCAASGSSSIQCISLTRSPEAPTMKTRDKFLFWKRMYEARQGKLIRTAIGNFLDEAYYSLTESEEGGTEPLASPRSDVTS